MRGVMHFVHGKLRARETKPTVTDLAPRRKTRRTSLFQRLTSVHRTLGSNIESPTFPASDQRLIGRMRWARVKTCSIDDALIKYWLWGTASSVVTDLASILHHRVSGRRLGTPDHPV